MRVEATQPRADYQVGLPGTYRLNFEKQAFALSGMDLKVSDATPGSKKPPLSLKGAVEFDASPQAIRFTLAADQLNLDRYLPPPEKAKAAAAGARPAATQPEQPIDLSALKGLNLKGDLKIDQLVASNVKLEKVHLGVKAAGGKVDAEPRTAARCPGQFRGAGSADLAATAAARAGSARRRRRAADVPIPRSSPRVSSSTTARRTPPTFQRGRRCCASLAPATSTLERM